LAVAVVLCAPLGDVSLALAIAPALRFPGWQWLLLTLTIPVASWCAWPFHRAALLGLCHGGTSMDTLVSVGVLAASGLSLHSIFFADAGGGGPSGVLGGPHGAICLDVASGVTTFVLAGRLFEERAKQRAGDAIATLNRYRARTARVLDQDETTTMVPVDLLRKGRRRRRDRHRGHRADRLQRYDW
jgi:cation transport ATPase